MSAVCHHRPVAVVRSRRAGLRRHRGHPLRNIASESGVLCGGYREAALPMWGRAAAPACVYKRLMEVPARATSGRFACLTRDNPTSCHQSARARPPRPCRRPFLWTVLTCTLAGLPNT
jgi:hypothetical protein